MGTLVSVLLVAAFGVLFVGAFIRDGGIKAPNYSQGWLSER